MTNQNIVLPAIALRGTTILPGMIVHFDVSRERSVKAIEAAMLHDQKIFLVTQIDPEVESPDLAGVYHVGTIAYIKQVVKLPQNLLRVLVEGTGRATLVKFEQEFPFIRSEITPVDEEEMQMPEPVMEAMHRSLKELFHRYCMENGKVSKELVAQILNIDNVEELVECMDAISMNMNYVAQKKKFNFNEGAKVVALERLLYIESRLHKLEFYIMEDKLKKYSIYGKLDELEKELQGNDFIRIHQSYLVNMKHIEKVSRYEALLNNGIKLEIPKARYKFVEETFVSYKGEI